MLRAPRLPRLVFTTLLTAFFALPAVAQQGLTTGAISGRVVDNTGAPIAGAEVTAANTETGVSRTVRSNDDGRYTIPLLRPGVYTVRSESPPLPPVDLGTVQVVIGEERIINVTFQPVELAAIQVTAEGATIDATQGGVVETISAQQIETLPTAGRDFTDFIALSGLISPQPEIGTGGQFSIGGARTSTTNVQIDGADANNSFFGENRGSSRIPFSFSLESIREFQIVTNGYDVEYGRFSGGVINAVTRGGTNQFRGSGFLYWQDEAITASNFDGTDPEDFQSFQFGGILSGPIIRDRLHYFVSGDFQRREQPTFALVPVRASITEAEINEFADILQTEYGIDPSNDIGVFEERDDQAALFGRLDWNIDERHQATLRANYTNFDNPNDRISTTGDEARTRGGNFQDNAISVVGELSSILTPTIYNTFRTQFSYEDRPRPGNSLLPSAEVDVADGTIGYGGAFFGILFANDLDERKFQFTDNLTFDLGEHVVKLGTDNIFTHTENLFWLNGNGFFTFNSLDDFRNRNSGFYFRLVPSDETGQPQTNPQAPFAVFDTREYALYAQDEWQVNDQLMLSFGLRYDYTDFADPGAPIRNASFQAAMDDVSQDVIGRTVSTTTVPEDGDNISPRFAFTYDLRGDERSLIRGGAGLFYSRIPTVLHGNVLSSTPDPLLAVICIAAAVPAFNYEDWQDGEGIPSTCNFSGFQPNPFGIGITGAPEITVWDEDIEVPQTWKANLGYEQMLGDRLKAGIQGIYSRTDNNFVTQILELNPQQFTTAEARPVFVEEADYEPDDSPSSPDRSRNDVLSRLYYQTSEGEAESWNVKLDLEGRVTDNLVLGANYVYTWAYDNSSFVCCTANAGIFDTPTAGDPNFLGDPGDDVDGNWGPSTFQRRHVFVTNAVWQAPWGLDVALIYRAQSGNPFTPAVAGDLNADGDDGNDRPYIPDPDNPQNVQFASAQELDQYRAIAAANECIRENVGRIIGRNACSNPSWHRVDLKLRRAFETFGGQRAEVILDVFNLLDAFGLDAGEFMTTRTELFRAEGYDAATQQVIYSVTESFGDEVPAGFEPFQFRAQLGVRYVF